MLYYFSWDIPVHPYKTQTYLFFENIIIMINTNSSWTEKSDDGPSINFPH